MKIIDYQEPDYHPDSMTRFLVAIKFADAAIALGIGEELAVELSYRCGIILDATTPSRPGKEGKPKWRDQEKTAFGFEDPTETTEDGLLKLLDQIVAEKLHRLEQKMRRKKQLKEQNSQSQGSNRSKLS